MAPSKKQSSPNDDRAKKTLYVTGFNSNHTTKHLLRELFSQGGPVTDVTMFDTHAYVRFQHEESVPYCLALFNEVELFGDKLRLNPRFKSQNTFCYMNYLSQVRDKLRDEYMSKEPPKLPAKKYPESPKKTHTPHKSSSRANKRRDSNERFSSNKNVSQRDRRQPKKQNKPKHTNKSNTTTRSTTSKTKRGKRGGQKKNKRIIKLNH